MENKKEFWKDPDFKWIILLIVIGSVFRFYNLNWDGTQQFHSDERNVITSMERIYFRSWNDSNFDPEFYVYGALPVYIGKMIQTVGSIFVSKFPTDIAARIVSALFGILSIPLLYLLGRRFFNAQVGLLSAVFLTLAVQHIQSSHFGTVENTLIFFLLLTVYFAGGISYYGRWQDYLLTGLAWGLSIATKFSAMSFGLIVFTAFLSHLLREKEKSNWGLNFAKFGAAIGVTAISGFIAAPHQILRFDRLRYAMDWEEGIVVGRIVANYVYQFEDTIPYLYQIKNLVLWHLGPFLGILAVLGFVYYIFRLPKLESGNQGRLFEYLLWIWIPAFFVAGYFAVPLKNFHFFPQGFLFLANGVSVNKSLAALWVLGLVILTYLIGKHRPIPDLVFICWVLFYIGFIGGWRVKFMRYILPVMPFLLILGAKLMIDLRQWAMQRRKWEKLWNFSMIFVLVGTFLYAFAFLHVYMEDNTRNQATKWLEENGGKNIYCLVEYWDDVVPMPPNAREPYILKLFENESHYKTEEMAKELSQGDYVILSSKRVYNSIFKLPESYPNTMNYYRLLFAGELGYELVQTFTSYPRILGFELVDEYAEGSFQWVDHPKVQIFKNVERLPSDKLVNIMSRPPAYVHSMTVDQLIMTDLNRETEKKVAKAGRKRRNYRESPITSAPENERPKTPFANHPVVWFYVVVQLIGLITFPLAFTILSALPDKGWIFSKPMGIAILTYMAWLFASLKIFEFSRNQVLLCLALMAMLSLYLYMRQKAGMVEFFKTRWRYIAWSEGVFLVLYLGFLLVRAYNPDLYWSEKPMDLSFTNIILRSKVFPPMDPWFSGYVINYYYYGQMINAMLIKLTEVPTHTGFNLIMGLIPAMVGSGAFAMAWFLSGRIFIGIIAVFGTTIFGSLDAVRQLWNWYYHHRGGWFDWWHAAHEIIPRTINELPYWSFLFSDVHAHVVVMPFFILFIAFQYQFFFSGKTGFNAIGDTRLKFILTLLVTCLCYGLFIPTNTWDAATHGCFLFLVFLSIRFFVTGDGSDTLHEWSRWFLFKLQELYSFILSKRPRQIWPVRRPVYSARQMDFYGGALYLKPEYDPLSEYDAVDIWGESAETEGTATAEVVSRPAVDFSDILSGVWGFVKDVAFPVALFPIIALIFYYPYMANYNPIKYSIGLAEQYTTTVLQFLTIFAYFFFASAVFLAFHWYARHRERGKGIAGFVIKVGLWLVGLAAYTLIMKHTLGWNHRVVALIAPFIFLAITSVGARFGSKQDRFASLIAVMGLGVLIGVELLHVVDFMGKGPHRRMNTLFKFHLHGHFLLGIFAAYAIYRTYGYFKKYGPNIWAKLAMQIPYYAVIGFTVVGMLAWTVLGTHAKLFREPRFHVGDVPTLDGFSYKKNIDQHEYEAQMWLIQNVEGRPVLLEATGESNEYYLDFNQGSMNTGLPGLLGWNSHVSQWNHPGWEIVERREDIRTMYESENIQETLRLLKKYNIKYIYVGRLERKQYQNKGFKKFDIYKEFFVKRFDNKRVQIYEFINREIEGEEITEKPIEISASGNLFLGGIGQEPGALNGPSDVVVALDGSFFVSDTLNHRVQKYDSQGNFQVAFGNMGSENEKLMTPRGLAIDNAANLLVVDTMRDRVAVFSQTGVFIKSFGEGRLFWPVDVAVGPEGDIIVTDTGNNQLVMFNSEGNYVRAIGRAGSDNGRFNRPVSVCTNDDSIFALDLGNQRIQKFDYRGRFQDAFEIKIQPDLSYGYPNMDINRKGELSITDPSANTMLQYTDKGTYKRTLVKTPTINNWEQPTGIFIDQVGNAYVLSSKNGKIVRKERPEAHSMFTGGQGDKPGKFNEPRDLACDDEGNVYVADFRNFRIQKYDSDGYFIQMWGEGGDGDGYFKDPCGITVAPDGTVYVADTWNFRVQKFSSDGTFIDKWKMEFNAPRGITTDAKGYVYLADSGNNRIIKLTPEGRRLWMVGGVRGANLNQFSEPIGICADGDELFICDTWNKRIKVYNLSGTYLRNIDAKKLWPGEAFREPYIDAMGDYIYVADPPNHRVVKIKKDGSQAFACVRPSEKGSDKFNFPMGVAVSDVDKVIYVSDTWNHKIRKLKDDDFRVQISLN